MYSPYGSDRINIEYLVLAFIHLCQWYIILWKTRPIFALESFWWRQGGCGSVRGVTES